VGPALAGYDAKSSGSVSYTHLDVYKRQVVLEADRVTTGNDHGTGCSLSAAIAANLALGSTTEEACLLYTSEQRGRAGPAQHVQDIGAHGRPHLGVERCEGLV